jgi:hypothetical protein
VGWWGGRGGDARRRRAWGGGASWRWRLGEEKGRGLQRGCRGAGGFVVVAKWVTEACGVGWWHTPLQFPRPPAVEGESGARTVRSTLCSKIWFLPLV